MQRHITEGLAHKMSLVLEAGKKCRNDAVTGSKAPGATPLRKPFSSYKSSLGMSSVA